MIRTFSGHPPMRRSAYSAFVFPTFLLATVAIAQTDNRVERRRDGCERDWNSDRAHFCEKRTYTIALPTRISVDGGANGGVAFIGENRRDVMIVAAGGEGGGGERHGEGDRA